MLDVAVAKPVLPKSGALVLLLAEGGSTDSPTGALWKAADDATGGAISRALVVAEFTGRKGQTATILAPGANLSRVIAIGIGPLDKADGTSLEAAGGIACAALSKDASASIATSGLAPDLAAHAALGAVLRAYRFDRYRTQEKAEDKPKLTKITLLADSAAKVKSAWAPLKGIADGVFIARDLVSEPPNVLHPAEMTRRIQALSALGLKIEVLGPKEMKKLGFGALLGVAQGSTQDPYTVIMHWNGAPTSKAAPLCFVGKGVTFDTGGISIKPAGGMEDMKWDMGGSGTVVGLMAALAGRKAKCNAIGIVGLVENMPDGNAQRPGDVVTTYSGQTVEVINTDAEGRLVLADIMWYAQEKYNPRFMIDLATLTGAMIIALGHEMAGFFSNDDTLSEQLAAAAKATGEGVWRLPLGEAYDKQIKSDIADMKNVGGRPGGSITAAQFIQRFVNNKPWIHLDIAGVAWSSKDTATTPKGATAYGVRLLDRLVADNFES